VSSPAPKPAGPPMPPLTRAAARSILMRHAALARTDPNLFVEYVMRDEETGKRVTQAPHHVAWQQLLSTSPRLVILAHNESGKSQQISIARVLWELGRDPTLRVVLLSNTYKQATRLLKSIKQYIESSQALHEVFPDLRPGATWTDSAITVKRNTFAKDPSVQVLGVHGNILGARTDLLLIDDLLDIENTRTPEMMQQCWDWLLGTLHTRLTERARVWVVGTPFHRDDALRRYADSGAYTAVSYPVRGEDGKSRWPSRWSEARIEQRRKELGPVEFARTMMCVPRDDESSRFKRMWVAQAWDAGRFTPGDLVADGIAQLPPGYRTYTGVDLAVQQHSAADETVLITLLRHPDDRREVVDIQAGRWSAPEILARIEDAHRRWGSLVFVENNACFVAGTGVLTQGRGYVPIEAVRVGELVWTHRCRWRKVTEVLRGKSRTLTDVKLRGGLPLTTTPNHWFWLRMAGRVPGRGGGHHRPVGDTQWASIGFASNDPVWAATAVPQWPSTPAVLDLPATNRASARSVEVTERLALLLGLFMAEGNASRAQVFWTLGSGERYLADFVESEVRRLIPGCLVTTTAHKSTLRVIANSTQLAKALKVGVYAQKTLPLPWLGWPAEIRVAVVRGWLLGDGCLTSNNGRAHTLFTGSTVSRNWALWVRTTLLNAGFRVGLATTPPKKYTIEGRNGWSKRAYQIRLPSEDSALLRRKMTTGEEARRWPEVSTGWKKSGGCVLDGGFAWLGVARGPGSWRAHGDAQFGGEVFNLTVEEDESFTAEDAVVHNAQAYIVQMLTNRSSIPVRGLTTGKNKLDPSFGVEKIAVHLSNGKYIFPCQHPDDVSKRYYHPELAKLEKEMLFYDPAVHTGDRLMALWIAERGIEVGEIKAETGYVNLTSR